MFTTDNKELKELKEKENKDMMFDDFMIPESGCDCEVYNATNDIELKEGEYEEF